MNSLGSNLSTSSLGTSEKTDLTEKEIMDNKAVWDYLFKKITTGPSEDVLIYNFSKEEFPNFARELVK